MANAGITRFSITDPITGRGAWRFRDSRKLQPAANQVYRRIFEDLNMPLLDGYEEVRCTKEEFIAQYDYELGIDVILTLRNGMEKTLQEKFLMTWYGTCTIEYYQDWRTEEPGDWFKIKAQNYFVGYDYPKTGKRLTHWIMLNWPCVADATAQKRIAWQTTRNKRDGARASFRFAHFDQFPERCVVAKHYHPGSPIERWAGHCAECGVEIRKGGYNKKWNRKPHLRGTEVPRVPSRVALCLHCYIAHKGR